NIIKHGDIVFIDEIHRLSKADQDYLLPIIEDFKDVEEFTLIGATTEGGVLVKPFYDRFKNKYQLVKNSVDELFNICKNAAIKIFSEAGVDVYSSGHKEICKRGRGTPRVALGLLEIVRDYAVAYNAEKIDMHNVSEYLNNEDIGPDGSM